MGGTSPKAFVGLRSKMYSIQAVNTKNKKTAKGILTIVKEKEIRHEDYKTTLFSAEPMMHKQTRIVQKEHELQGWIQKFPVGGDNA